MFFRIKKISGKEYAYKVKNKWTEKGARQKVIGYIGRVLRPKISAEESSSLNIPFHDFIGNILKKDARSYMAGIDFDSTIFDLIAWQLYRHGADVLQENTFMILGEEIKIDKNSATSNGKGIAVKIGEGFLCSSTLRQVFGIGLEEEQEAGMDFAQKLVNAGLDVPKEIFVLLYEKLS